MIGLGNLAAVKVGYDRAVVVAGVGDALNVVGEVQGDLVGQSVALNQL